MVVPSTLALRMVAWPWPSSIMGITSARLANGADRSDMVSRSCWAGLDDVPDDACDRWDALDAEGLSSRTEDAVDRFGWAWQLRIAWGEGRAREDGDQRANEADSTNNRESVP